MIKADNDLKTATQTLKMGVRSPTDTVCFHAQQCVEKYAKASLAFSKIEFPKTHDIEALIQLMPEGARPRLSIQEQRRLTAYATVTRYPGEYDEISLDEAREAVAPRVRAQHNCRVNHEIHEKHEIIIRPRKLALFSCLLCLSWLIFWRSIAGALASYHRAYRSP
jgi:HEPN domain-containing protein